MNRIALLGLVLLAAGAPARADELRFKNGDRWSGTLLTLAGGKVAFRTELVGKLEVAASELQSLSTSEPVEIQARDGSTRLEVLSDADPAGFEAINPPEPAWSGRVLAGAEFQRGNTIKDSAYSQLDAAYAGGAHRVALRASYDGERTEDTSPRERSRRQTPR